ncbi:MAG: hypothetical protein L0Y64_27090, partial [Myxococcaceae bacterium]|nr:hypothetical protein [Myxococcaceae bacterium]
NAASVAMCRNRGFVAYTPEEFRASEHHLPGRFDSLLLSHVAEHMQREEAAELVRSYAPLVKPRGKLILVTPQEAGHRRDPTHVEFMDFVALSSIVQRAGFRSVRAYSFPFPRALGSLFAYNEFVSVGVKD